MEFEPLETPKFDEPKYAENGENGVFKFELRRGIIGRCDIIQPFYSPSASFSVGKKHGTHR